MLLVCISVILGENRPVWAGFARWWPSGWGVGPALSACIFCFQPGLSTMVPSAALDEVSGSTDVWCVQMMSPTGRPWPCPAALWSFFRAKNTYFRVRTRHAWRTAATLLSQPCILLDLFHGKVVPFNSRAWSFNCRDGFSVLLHYRPRDCWSWPKTPQSLGTAGVGPKRRSP